MTISAYLLMCLIYGTTFLAIKLGMMEGFAPFFFAGIRFAAAGLLVIGCLLAVKAALPRSKRAYVDLIRLGICMTFLPFAALYWGEQHISSGFAALLTAFGPISVFLFGLLLERKRSAALQWLGILLAMFGLYLVVLPNLDIGVSAAWILSAAVILLSEVAYAWGAIFSKRLLSQGITPMAMNGFQMFFGSLGLLLLSLIWEPEPLPSAATPTAIGSLLYLILFGSLASSLYYWLIKRTNPLFPSTWLYVSPVIALVVGYLVLGEPIYPLSAAGTVLVIAGVVLTNLPDWKDGRRRIPTTESTR